MQIAIYHVSNYRAYRVVIVPLQAIAVTSYSVLRDSNSVGKAKPGDVLLYVRCLTGMAELHRHLGAYLVSHIFILHRFNFS